MVNMENPLTQRLSSDRKTLTLDSEHTSIEEVTQYLAAFTDLKILKYNPIVSTFFLI
eukprot:m.163428 g.163428  ORF g.163428 m.163428 type:complete len:57 (-) comp15218_c0_seq4:647-817(-)